MIRDDGAHWWRHTHDALDIVRETLGSIQRMGGISSAPKPELNMPVRSRNPNETAKQVMPLMLLGIALVASNNYFTVIDDEAWILDAATQPVRTTIGVFLSGTGQHEHPPLYDIVLHFWLRWTGGSFEYLRLPAIVILISSDFFFLGRAAQRLAGAISAARAVVWLWRLLAFWFSLWPPVAAWYAFSFFLVSGLTHAYLRYSRRSKRRTLDCIVLACKARRFVWTNYFGWGGSSFAWRLTSFSGIVTPSDRGYPPSRHRAGTAALR